MAETTVRDAPVRETAARLRHVSISPPKVRMVLDLIRGQDVETARDTLHFCERSAAHEVGKLLDSAIANAEHNAQIPEDELFVIRAHADDGPTLKRWRPRARGRGVPIHKRSSHITIVVARFADEDLERRRRADAASGRDRRRVVRRRRKPAEAEPADEIPEDDEAAESAAVMTEDDEVDTDDQAGAAAPKAKKATAKKATAKKATAKKATAKKATAKKATAAKKTTKAATKTTKKSPAKKAPTETSAKESKPRKAPTKRPPKTKKDED
jgi:large subunit ribosomal protein L22